MSFYGGFEKMSIKSGFKWSFQMSIKSGFKWSFPIMNIGKCRRSTGINFRTLIVFDLHERLVKQKVYSLIRNFFADGTSLFPTVQDIITSTVSLNHDLTEISELAV